LSGNIQRRERNEQKWKFPLVGKWAFVEGKIEGIVF
jgi:hypothetical protein